MPRQEFGSQWVEQIAFFLARYFDGRPITKKRRDYSEIATIFLEVPKHILQDVQHYKFPHAKWDKLQGALKNHWGAYLINLSVNHFPRAFPRVRLCVQIGTLNRQESVPSRYVYHITGKQNLSSIKREGLRSYRAGIYVIDSKKLLKKVIENFDPGEAPWPYEDGVVLTIDTTLLGYFSDFYVDVEFRNRPDGNYYWIHGDVPPEAIVKVETLPRAGRDKSRVLEESPPESPYEHLEVPPRKASSPHEQLRAMEREIQAADRSPGE